MLIPQSIFDVWGHMRTLCVRLHLRGTPDATRPFLVDITPSKHVLRSRTVFSVILVHRDPSCEKPEMCVYTYTVSSHETVVSDVFLSRMSLEWINTHGV